MSRADSQSSVANSRVPKDMGQMCPRGQEPAWRDCERWKG